MTGTHCMNVITESEGHASAVLLRALEPVAGIAMNTKGPGLLCRAMDIDTRLIGSGFCHVRILHLPRTRASACEELRDACSANEDIDNPLGKRPVADEPVDKIPVRSNEAAEAHEAPVQSTNSNKDGHSQTDSAAILHGMRGKRGRLGGSVPHMLLFKHTHAPH